MELSVLGLPAKQSCPSFSVIPQKTDAIELRSKKVEDYYFQYWIDVPGQEERKRETEVVGPVGKISKSEAERKNKDFISKLQLNSNDRDKKPPFSQEGLAIPERDKLQMKMRSRHKASFSWAQAEQIAEQIRKLDNLGDARREQYATLILLIAASAGKIGPCKNVTAYRTVLLADSEGQRAMRQLCRFVGDAPTSTPWSFTRKAAAHL